ncbi:MAG: cytochrome c [Deltaproteobacteria bacterium]|nr:cytochrome c [Deltaproteobacteria bacterium]TLN00776.1 MAG: c-type cytochrome [bacterium]
MKKKLISGVIAVIVCFAASSGFTAGTKGKQLDGKALFQKHCAVCHPNGGNIISKNKPISVKAMKANGVVGVKGIVAKMRNPGPLMNKFDEKTISNQEAKAIADYIVKTFK